MASGINHQELIIGGQKSGKSRYALARAQQWLIPTSHDAILLTTAIAGDPEMTERIKRHQLERQSLMPSLKSQEVCGDLAEMLKAYLAPHRLVIVDCLTVWLTQLMYPPSGYPEPLPSAPQAVAQLLEVLKATRTPWIIVSNEIGLGVIPASVDTRQFVDQLGVLHQRIADLAQHLTLMVAGVALPIKAASP